MNIKELHNYTLTQAGQILLLNYDDQVAKDPTLSSICKSQRDYDKLCKAYRTPLALMLQGLNDAGRYYAELSQEELEQISEIFHLACNAKLSYQSDIAHIDTDKLLRIYADRKLGWDKGIRIVEQLVAEHNYNGASDKRSHCDTSSASNPLYPARLLDEADPLICNELSFRLYKHYVRNELADKAKDSPTFLLYHSIIDGVQDKATFEYLVYSNPASVLEFNSAKYVSMLANIMQDYPYGLPNPEKCRELLAKPESQDESLKVPELSESWSKVENLYRLCHRALRPLILLSLLDEDLFDRLYSNCRETSRKGTLDAYTKELMQFFRIDESLNSENLNRHYLDFSKRMAAINLGISPADVDAKYVVTFGFNREDALACFAHDTAIYKALVDKIDGYPLKRKVGTFSFSMYSQNIDMLCDGIIDLYQDKMSSTQCRQFYTRSGLDKIIEALNIEDDDDIIAFIKNTYKQGKLKPLMRNKVLL
ncbi:MAG: hypothetical protein R3Y46_07460 [Opitutales bacterium]